MPFAKNLDLIMKNKKISNTELATKFFTTCATASRWRNGVSKPPLEILPELCIF